MTRLVNDVAIVTGGARGIGAAIVRALAAEGAQVVIADVLDVPGRALALELGDGSEYVSLDVADEAGWQRAVTTARSAFGDVSVLVNNAGIYAEAALEDHPIESWRSVLDIDLTGPFLGMKHVTPGMKRQRRGSIVNISSNHGIRGATLCYGYTASKWGLRGITRSAALELGSFGVRVNALLPGYIETPMTEDDTPENYEIPLLRSGHADEVARCVVFLASDDSSYVTGTEFVIDGGMTAGLPLYDSLNGFQLSGPIGSEGPRVPVSDGPPKHQ